ncbi:MAG: response regulator transcription factor [Armatimonadota bacterium]|jgi:DNA-binding response OmpR family regulator
MRPTILVVEDDDSTRKMIKTALTQNGFDVVDASTAADAIEAMGREHPDVVLLDLILPDGDGVQVCKEVRQYSEVSIIMVTAKRDLTDRLAGLNAGADDYVTKPLAIGELVARVNSLLRRKRMREQEEPAEMQWSGVSLQSGSRVASVAGREATLNEIEAEILATLIEAKGRPLSLDQIADRVWDDGEGDPMVLETHIANIRHKLEEDPDAPRHVVSEAGGYRIG